MVDIISLLISRGSFHHIILDILINLKLVSISQMALTCKMWANFIAREVKGSAAFETRRIGMHFREKKPEIDVIGIYSCGPYS